MKTQNSATSCASSSPPRSRLRSAIEPETTSSSCPDDIVTTHADPEQGRSGGAELAGGVGRQGLDAAAAPDLGRRDAVGLRARAAGVQRQHGRPGDRRTSARRRSRNASCPPTANLDIWWCQGFSEPEAGSDLASLRTRAVRDGDDYVINGQKTWTTLGQYADWIFVLARTNPDAPKKQAGISFILVEMSTPGITLRPIKLIDGSYEVNEVFFEDVRVPANQLVGEENQGWTYAKFLLSNERTGIARIGTTKVWLADVKERAAQTRVGSGSLLDGSAVRRPGRRDRKRAAGTGTHAAAGQRRRGHRQAEPGLVDPEASRQPAAAGRHRAAGGGRRTGRAAVRRRRATSNRRSGRSTRAPQLPELPQDLDLRRKQRGAAHHHLLDDPGTVT